ncbi:MAG: chromosome segregation protein SMC [Actinomycetota bacterium]
MFLRQIQIRGFKSFADKTVLEFIPGVSVIVGPNGSGKSNLVDAISWALGEQGPRALRGGQMADVIFSGTPSRPALGMAEVKLVIDNEAGLIPVPMSEIEVSRSIFRSGDSEYRINGKLARLMDVQELLSETGIGRALHTVVGQGQLEEVLNARPEERRKYIEEAAGIAKHRRRKERAERKLASLDNDLLRLQDVMTELRRQLKPLRQQAEMAEKHETLTDQAEELSRKLAAARLRGLLAERDRRRSGWDEGLSQRQEARARLDALDGEVLAGADARAGAARRLADTEVRFRSAQVDRSEADQGFRSALDREGEARRALASQAGRAARLDAVEAELARVEADLEQTIGELAERERELEDAEAAFRAADQHRREVDELRRRAGEEAVGRRVEIEALERAMSSGVRERDRLETDLRAVGDRAAALRAEREDIEGDIERLDGQTSPLAERRTQLEGERRRATDKVEELEDVERRQQARLDLLEARRRDIEDTAGSRFLEANRGRASGVLRDLVRAEAGLERALLSALGPLADAVVYVDRQQALAAAPEGGGAILAIATGGPVPQGLSGERPLLSVVDADPAARGIVSTVLRDIYLAGSIEEAAEKQAANPGASFVTPDGTLVGPAVIHTPKGIDSRAREIRAELQVLAHDLAGTRSRLKPQRQRLAETTGEIEFLNQQIEAADADITTQAERLAAIERDLAAVGREDELFAERLGGVREAEHAARDRLAELGPAAPDDIPELPPLPQPPVQARVTVETLRRDRASLDAHLARLRTERDEASTQDPQQLRSDLEAAETARAAAEHAAAGAEHRATAAADERDAAAAAEREAASHEADVNTAWREASTELDRLRETYEEDDRLRGDIERRVRDAERLLHEGHGTEPAAALEMLTPEDSVESLEKASELVQRRLGLLGRVNLLATGEFEAVQERHDFMQRELDDVRKARRDLLELVAQVDQEIQESFSAAFRDVATQFERLVKELFPGGEGRLVLTDLANPLEAGVEIEASPGRKRVKRISLLSGGERSLAALAFLFAIFSARPSPFYLMDEVEPALDDLNLHRFLRLVAGFARDAQVMIVTHQKRTMEIASMMYGVSLNKDGTTKILCQRLEQPEVTSDAGREGQDPMQGLAGGPASGPVEVPQRERVG